jgi:phosphatidylglycerophosphate synthase
MVVAGLTVIERACKQLLRLGHRVVIAAEPDFPLPAGACRPPFEVRHVQSTAGPGSLTALRAELGQPIEVAADVVRTTGRLDAPAHRVRDEPSRRRAEDAVFAELLRGDLGLVARTLNKPISFRITRYLLCRLPVTPNQVTIAAGMVGLLGACFIAVGSPLSLPLGFLLAHLQSVLDGCDGELARVRLQQSSIGEWLDTVVDDALNLVLTAAIGVGLWRAHGRPLYLVAGLIAAAMLLTYNIVAYRELIRQGEGGEVLKVRWWFTRGAALKRVFSEGQPTGPSQPSIWRRRLFGLLTTIARRDFFLFAWLVLALVGLGPVILLYAFGLALTNFVGAIGQLIYRARA